MPRRSSPRTASSASAGQAEPGGACGPATEPDAVLARRARGGSRDAFRELVVRHQRGVLSLVRRALRDPADAEDVAQDTFLQAWQALDRYDPRRRFSTWLYTIAARRAVSWLRRSDLRTTVEVLAEEPSGSGAEGPGARRGEGGAAPSAADREGDDPAAVVARREEARALWRLADEVLAPDQRLALWLRYAEDLDAREIGRVLGRTPVAARLLLMRARRRLAARAAHAPLAPDASPSGAEPHV